MHATHTADARRGWNKHPTRPPSVSYWCDPPPLSPRQVVSAADAISREALAELVLASGLPGGLSASLIPAPLRALAPPLSESDRKVVDSIRKLVGFFLGSSTGHHSPPAGGAPGSTGPGGSRESSSPSLLRDLAPDGRSLKTAQALLPELLPVLRENQVEMRRFGLQIVGRLVELQTSRALGWARSEVLGERRGEQRGRTFR